MERIFICEQIYDSEVGEWCIAKTNGQNESGGLHRDYNSPTASEDAKIYIFHHSVCNMKCNIRI